MTTHPSHETRSTSTCRRPASGSTRSASQRPSSWRHPIPIAASLVLVWMIALKSSTSMMAFGFSQPKNPTRLLHPSFVSSSCLHARSKIVHGSTTRFDSRSKKVVHDSTTIDNEASDADDLTKEQFLLRLSEVRNYYRENPDEKITQADICLKLLCTRLSKLRLHRCYVGTSTIPDAGNGLFAGRDIEEGELITLYPGDAVLLQGPTKKEDDDSPVVTGVMFGSHVQGADRNTSRVATHDARGYEMEINQYTTIVGDPLVKGVSNTAAYLGHFVNDGACLQAFDADSRALYSQTTALKCNAAHYVMEGAHMGTVALRAIPKGDEIFCSYEEGYWLSRSDSTLATNKQGVLVEIKAAVAASELTESRRPERRQNKKKKMSSKGSSEKKGFG